MNRRVLWAAVAGLVLGVSGCRTKVSSVRPPPAKPVFIGDRSCMVQDFPSAVDVPEGSKNLGWVSVPDSGDDEKTYIQLREKVCAMEGDGISQAAWVQESTDSGLVLKANAWQLP